MEGSIHEMLLRKRPRVFNLGVIGRRRSRYGLQPDEKGAMRVELEGEITAIPCRLGEPLAKATNPSAPLAYRLGSMPTPVAIALRPIALMFSSHSFERDHAWAALADTSLVLPKTLIQTASSPPYRSRQTVPYEIFLWHIHSPHAAPSHGSTSHWCRPQIVLS